MSEQGAAAAAGTDTTGTATDTTTQTTTTNTSTASNEPWFHSLDPETRNWIDSKGYSDPDMGKVMPKVLSSYRNAEQLISKIKGDPNQILVMPKDMSNVEEVTAFREKLGVPRDIKDYGVEFEAGSKTQSFLEMAQKSGMSKEATANVMEWTKTLGEQAAAEEAKQYEETSAKEMQDWQREQGATFDQKMQLAKSAFTMFPQIKEKSAEIEKALGTKNYMQFLADLGSKVGEAGSIGADGGGSNTGMTPAAARQAIQQLQADPVRSKALLDDGHPGHASAKAEWIRLHNYAHPNM